jgi:hypothetical protein
MAYSKKDIEWLRSININENIEVLVDCGDSYQWLMLSEGILKTNSKVFDHRYLGDTLGMNKLDWAEKPYLGTNECVV